MVHTKVSSFKKGGKTVVVTLGDLGIDGYVSRAERKRLTTEFRADREAAAKGNDAAKERVAKVIDRVNERKSSTQISPFVAQKRQQRQKEQKIYIESKALYDSMPKTQKAVMERFGIPKENIWKSSDGYTLTSAKKKNPPPKMPGSHQRLGKASFVRGSGKSLKDAAYNLAVAEGGRLKKINVRAIKLGLDGYIEGLGLDGW